MQGCASPVAADALCSASMQDCAASASAGWACSAAEVPHIPLGMRGAPAQCQLHTQLAGGPLFQWFWSPQSQAWLAGCLNWPSWPCSPPAGQLALPHPPRCTTPAPPLLVTCQTLKTLIMPLVPLLLSAPHGRSSWSVRKTARLCLTLTATSEHVKHHAAT